MICLGTIGEKIEKKRIEKGWSRKELSDKVNITYSYLSKIECGDKIPNLETFISIVAALDVSADELLADALDKQTGIEMAHYIERIEQKDSATRMLIYKVMDATLDGFIEKDETNRQGGDYINRNSYYTGI